MNISKKNMGLLEAYAFERTAEAIIRVSREQAHAD